MINALTDDADNIGGINKERISDALKQNQYLTARVLWILFIDGHPINFKEQSTLTFLSDYFKSSINRDWSENLVLIWRDIQKIWPESEDYIRLYHTAIKSLDYDPHLKEIILTTLLRSDHSRKIARECYRMSPKASRIYREALAYLINNLNYELQKNPHEKKHNNINAPSFSKILNPALRFTADFSPIGDITFYPDSETEFADRIEQAIVDKYISFGLFSKDIHQIDDEIRKKEREMDKIADSIRRTGALSGLTLDTDDPVEIFDLFSKRSKYLEKLHLSETELNELISVKEFEISELVDKFEILEKKADNTASNMRIFGYVDKPVERFLTYCQDVTKEVLIQSLVLIQEKMQSNHLKTEKLLPYWFISEFEIWYEEKKKSSKSLDQPIQYQRKSLLALKDRMNGIQLVIPEQIFSNHEGLDQTNLVVYDDKQIIYEKEVPLYCENNKIFSQEVKVEINSPSSAYHVEFISNNSSLSWDHEAFTPQNDYLLFNFESHHQILSKNIPSHRFILLTDKKLSINPESIIVETGQLFGDWDGFTYFFIDPSAAESIKIDIRRDGAESKNDRYLEVQLEPRVFDKNLRINNQRVITGSPPKLELSFDSIETLLDSTLSLHSDDPCTLDKSIFYELEKNCHLLNFDPEKNICFIDLGQNEIFGHEPVGLFTIRIRNRSCKTDTRIECLFIPHLSYRFSQQLYLPEKGRQSSVRLFINSRNPIEFNPEPGIVVQVKEHGIILESELKSEIQGQINYWVDEKRFFSGHFSLPVPQLVWQMEDEKMKTVWPLQRVFRKFYDAEYDSFGNYLSMTVFLPESWDGQGILSMDPGGQYVVKKIVNGKGKFSLARFHDSLNISDADSILFYLSLNANDKKETRCPLFCIKRWYVSPIKDHPRVIVDKTGNRIIELAWKENYPAKNRSIILWRHGRSESKATHMYESKIPDDTYNIRIDMSRFELPGGIYYLQFIRKTNEWDITPSRFTGESPNTFQITIEIKDEELLAKADTLFRGGSYAEAVLLYIDFEMKYPDLGAIWRQKIMNSLIYPRNFFGAITCFQEILPEKNLLKDTDYSFISFRLVEDLIQKPPFLDFSFIQGIINICRLISESKMETPKTIIKAHMKDIKKVFDLLENPSEHEKEQIIQYIQFLDKEFA